MSGNYQNTQKEHATGICLLYFYKRLSTFEFKKAHLKYSRTSMAQTPMARFNTMAVSNSFLSPLEKNHIAADLG